MPDPRQLKIGDRVRFVSLPQERDQSDRALNEDSLAFMKLLIALGRPCRVARIEKDGYPWIDARVRGEGGVIVYAPTPQAITQLQLTADRLRRKLATR